MDNGVGGEDQGMYKRGREGRWLLLGLFPSSASGLKSPMTVDQLAAQRSRGLLVHHHCLRGL